MSEEEMKETQLNQSALTAEMIERLHKWTKPLLLTKKSNYGPIYKKFPIQKDFRLPISWPNACGVDDEPNGPATLFIEHIQINELDVVPHRDRLFQGLHVEQDEINLSLSIPSGVFTIPFVCTQLCNCQEPVTIKGVLDLNCKQLGLEVVLRNQGGAWEAVEQSVTNTEWFIEMRVQLVDVHPFTQKLFASLISSELVARAIKNRLPAWINRTFCKQMMTAYLYHLLENFIEMDEGERVV